MTQTRALLLSLLFCLPGPSWAGQGKASPAAGGAGWSVRPNEALDALMLINAVSQDEFTMKFYPDLRNKWTQKLGPEGMRTADALFNCCSMSGTALLLSFLKAETLEDLTAALSEYDGTHARIEAGLAENGWSSNEPRRKALADLDRNHGLLLEYFKRLQKAGFTEDWNAGCRPVLEKEASRLQSSLAKYSIPDAARAISAFLGRERRPAAGIFLLYYCKPIAFQLTGGYMGSMVMEGPSGEAARRFASNSLHESLHGFPNSAEAMVLQEKILAADPVLRKEYSDLLNKWHSGPEEYFVVAAEADLSERLGIRDHSQCLQYLNKQNGGMRFSRMIYEVLQATRPYLEPGWPGYGSWLIKAMKDGTITRNAAK